MTLVCRQWDLPWHRLSTYEPVGRQLLSSLCGPCYFLAAAVDKTQPSSRSLSQAVLRHQFGVYGGHHSEEFGRWETGGSINVSSYFLPFLIFSPAFLLQVRKCSFGVSFTWISGTFYLHMTLRF